MNRLARLVLLAGLLAPLALPAGARAQDLLQAWQAAAQHDHQLAVARAEHAASQTLRDQAGALWKPGVSLGIGAGLGVQENAMRGARFSAPGMGTMEGARFATSVQRGLATQVTLQARQPLLDPARDAQRAQLQLGADMGDTAWHGAQARLMLDTAQRYFALALAEERVRVTERQAQALARARTEAHDRYQLGDTTITDTHEADAAHAGVRAEQADAEQEASVQREALVGSTGLQAPSARLPQRVLPPPAALTEWQRAADAANPRLRLLAQAVQVAEQELQQRHAASRPTLDLVAQAAHQRIAGRGDFGSARNRSVDGMVGVQLNIPLSSGGMNTAREREATERLNQTRAELNLAREEVRQQVQAAWLGLQAGSARITALDEALQASAARLDATRLGLEVGDRTTLDLLGAEHSLAQAELALAQARVQQVLTRLQLAALADRLDEPLLIEVNALLAAPRTGATLEPTSDQADWTTSFQLPGATVPIQPEDPS